MKYCKSCNIFKSVNEFNKNKVKKDGLQDLCRECTKQRFKKYYSENSEFHKKVVFKNNKRKLAKRKIFYEDFKSTLKCSKCNENHPATLDFHHLDKNKKEYDVASMMCRGYSVEKVMTEVNKCIVLCSNCHRKLHWEERNK